MQLSTCGQASRRAGAEDQEVVQGADPAQDVAVQAQPPYLLAVFHPLGPVEGAAAQGEGDRHGAAGERGRHLDACREGQHDTRG